MTWREVGHKILAIFIALALCACLSVFLSSCGRPGPGYNSYGGTLFERVATYDDCNVYRHKGNNVLYAYSGSGFTVMLNPDGTAMVWEGY